ISAWWHMAGVAIIVAILIIVPDHHQSASYVFTKTINNSGFSGHGWHSPVFWFVFGLGLLMAQYTITGYDASAHMSEETRNAARAHVLGDRDRDPVVGPDDPDVLEQRNRLSRRHLDRCHRPLHRLRASDHPALAGRREL